MFPKIKDSVSVVYRKIRNTYEVNFLLNASSIILPFHLNQEAFECLQYFDGLNSIDDIAHHVNISKQEVVRLVNVLSKKRVLITNRQITTFISGRFETQLNFFAEFETKGLSREMMQVRLNEAHIVIIGLGGIGTWVVQGLALAGVRNFTLIDPDLVEISNLNRQCLFASADIGLPKVKIAKQRLKMIDAEISVHAIIGKVISADDCFKLVNNTNLIINCADEPSTDALNRIVTDVGFALDVPHVLCGGYDGHLSFIGPTVIPGKSACWYCYEHALDRQLHRADYHHLTITNAHIKGGNMAAISAIAANYHVLDAIKVITGFSKPTMINKAAELDFRTFEINFRTFRKRGSCRYCGKKGELYAK